MTPPADTERYKNHRFPGDTAFVAELPQRVSGALVRRGAAAVRALAAELASPAVGHAGTFSVPKSG